MQPRALTLTLVEVDGQGDLSTLRKSVKTQGTSIHNSFKLTHGQPFPATGISAGKRSQSIDNYFYYGLQLLFYTSILGPRLSRASPNLFNTVNEYRDNVQ